MGYTHYFSLAKQPSAKAWSAFTNEVQAILAHRDIAPIVCFDSNEPTRPPRIDSEVVQFNGRGIEGHETLYLPSAPHKKYCKTGGPNQSEDFGDQWGKSYDLAVCAVLLAAHRHLGESVSSDGEWDASGWEQARRLYARITGHIPRAPWKIKKCAKCPRVFAAKGHAWGGGSKICVKCGCTAWRGYRTGRTTPVMHCMDCGGTKSRTLAPLSWCYYCSNGYTDEADAKQKLRDTWTRVLDKIEKTKKTKGRHLKIVDDTESK